MNPVKNAFNLLFSDTIQMFRSLKGNSRICLSIEPLWTVFFITVTFFQTLYMKELGLTETQIGLVTSLSFTVQAVSLLLGGPITDRLGRKKTTFIFDSLAWTGGMLIWSLAQNIWYFIAAALMNGLVKIVYVSWICLMVEDADNEERISIFTILSMISLVFGLFTPLAGLLIDRMGLVPAMRILYFTGCISMTTMFIIRNVYAKETALGKKLMEEHQTLTFNDRITDYLDALKYITAHPNTIMIFLINVLLNFNVGINIYYTVFIKEVLYINPSLASIFPGIASLSMIFSVLFIIPRLRSRNLFNNITIGILLSITGWFIFLVSPAKNLVILGISSAITALGTSITNPFKDTVLNNSIGEKERAKLFSLGQSLVSFTLIPSGIIAGVLYKISPALPFILIAILFIVCLVLVSIMRSRSEDV